MKCFYHPASDAVGVCKHCQRGLCTACAAEPEGGLACRDRHEAIVDSVSRLIDRNVNVLSRAAPLGILAMLVYWIGGAIFTYFAIMMKDMLGHATFGVLAALMFFCAIANTVGFVARRKSQISRRNP